MWELGDGWCLWHWGSTTLAERHPCFVSFSSCFLRESVFREHPMTRWAQKKNRSKLELLQPPQKKKHIFVPEKLKPDVFCQVARCEANLSYAGPQRTSRWLVHLFQAQRPCAVEARRYSRCSWMCPEHAAGWLYPHGKDVKVVASIGKYWDLPALWFGIHMNLQA